jgi:hypothetical protein
MANNIRKTLLYFLFPLLSVGNNAAQPKWPELCKVVEIPSSVDGKIQPAYFYQSKGNTPRPLIVSLHAWSSGYDEKDPLSWQ